MGSMKQDEFHTSTQNIWLQCTKFSCMGDVAPGVCVLVYCIGHLMT